MAPLPELSVRLTSLALHSGHTVKALASVKPHEQQLQMDIFSDTRFNPLRHCAQNIDGAGNPRTAKIMGQTDICVLNLVWMSPSQLLYNFVNLSEAGCANRVPLGLEATAGIYRQITAYLGPAFRSPATTVPLLHETEILGVDDLGNRKAIMQLYKINVRWFEA